MQSLQIARDIPGFGGFFFDQAGNLVAYLKDRNQRDAAVRALEPLLRTRPRGAARETFGTQPEVVIRDGQYDFLELAAWRDEAVLPVLEIPGANWMDLDEGRNRVAIGIESASVRERVEARLAQLGVPREAVIIEVTGRIQSALTLRERTRPIQGGYQLEFLSPSSGHSGQCTWGPTGKMTTSSGFTVVVGLTNSHCTPKSWDADDGRFYQPSISSDNEVGWEYLDPNGKSCGTFSTRVCRYADVAAVALGSGSETTPSDIGYIGRTTFRSPGYGSTGSLEIDPNNPRLRVIGYDQYPVTGDIVNKIGRTTGWTYGDVGRTCVDTEVPYRSNSVLRCQDYANVGVQRGDSGSPVFLYFDTNDVTIQGILWGFTESEMIFSAWSNIEQDIGIVEARVASM